MDFLNLLITMRHSYYLPWGDPIRWIYSPHFSYKENNVPKVTRVEVAQFQTRLCLIKVHVLHQHNSVLNGKCAIFWTLSRSYSFSLRSLHLLLRNLLKCSFCFDLKKNKKPSLLKQCLNCTLNSEWVSTISKASFLLSAVLTSRMCSLKTEEKVK